MGCDEFRFKRFAIRQRGCAMKVGTDGVLLGAWMRLDPSDCRLLDIGTGTGVVALMAAQRTEGYSTRIDAIEIDPSSCRQAAENIAESPWSDRIVLHPASLQEFALEKSRSALFDHIFSNPPYFSDSLESPDAARNRARHTATLDYETLLRCSADLLHPQGRLSLVLPIQESEKMINLALDKELCITRRTDVRTTVKNAPKRVLLEFSRANRTPELNELIIEGATPGCYTEAYRNLTRDFYLKF